MTHKPSVPIAVFGFVCSIIMLIYINVINSTGTLGKSKFQKCCIEVNLIEIEYRKYIN